MIFRLTICLVAIILTAIPVRGADYDDNPVCGRYVATAGGGEIEIIPLSQFNGELSRELNAKYSLSAQYVILLGNNPSPILQPGTIMGWLAPLAKAGLYEAEIFTKEKDGRLQSARRFILQLNPEGSLLSMHEIKHRLRVDPLRFLPYLFHGISLKGTLKIDDNTDLIVEGFLKTYPRPAIPLIPRQL